MDTAASEAHLSVEAQHELPARERAPARREHLAGGDERALLVCEIISVVSSVLLAEWAVLALAEWNRSALLVPVVLACALMFTSQRLRGETARELGLGGANFTRALRLLVPLMIGGALLLVLGAWLRFGTLATWERARGGWALVGFAVWGGAWGFVQQYALQAFINRRLQMLWGTGWHTTLVVAALFALLHLPNPALTAATFAGGLMWAWVYQRAPNLWALAISHAVMTWVLIVTLPAGALAGLRVGYKYFG